MIKKKNLILLDLNFCRSSLSLFTFIYSVQSLILFISQQETTSSTEHENDGVTD